MDKPDDLRFKDPEPRIHPTAELKACRLGRYAAIGGLCVVLLFACHWLDRLTQGWLTLRLRSLCLLLALCGACLLYPWA